MKRAKKKAAKKPVAKKKAVKAKPARRPRRSHRPSRSRAVSRKPGQAKADGTVTWNFKLLSHHLLDGFGGMGEGMSVQIAPDGRRIIWLAHESAPKNFTAVDVSDPRKPKVVCQTDLPQSHMRSNSLETCGNIMAVAYQTQKKGLQPAGMELFDISNPEKPKSISFFDCSGQHSRGVHQLWFCDGEYVHMASSSAGLRADASAGRPVLPLHRRAQSVEAGRSRPLAHAGHQAGRQRRRRRRAIRSTRATARTTATSIRSGRTAATSPISTAACTSSTSPTRPTRSASRPGPTRRPTPASCTRWCRCSTAA